MRAATRTLLADAENLRGTSEFIRRSGAYRTPTRGVDERWRASLPGKLSHPATLNSEHVYYYYICINWPHAAVKQPDQHTTHCSGQLNTFTMREETTATVAVGAAMVSADADVGYQDPIGWPTHTHIHTARQEARRRPSLFVVYVCGWFDCPMFAYR